MGEGAFFSATDIEGSRLLSVQPEARFSNAQGRILNQASLVVRNGENIILIADNVTNMGNLKVPSGGIELWGNETVLVGGDEIHVSGDNSAGRIANEVQKKQLLAMYP